MSHSANAATQNRQTARHHAALAHCQAATALNTATLAIAINMDGDQVPDEIQLLPAGTRIVGRDGREWLHDRPELVIANTQANDMDLPLDWEHATEHAPWGGPAPAAGWLDPQSLVLRDGATWIKVDWTTKGRDSVANRDYRYLSPVFEYESESRRIIRLISAALTNRPNLRLQALNQQQETHPMDERLLEALGLPKDATAEQALTALNAMKTKLTDTQTQLTETQTTLASTQTKLTETDTALQTARQSASTPDMTQYVPMAQYNQVMTRATEAETALQSQCDAEQEAAIHAAVDAAIEGGKIAPATRDFYVQSCQQEGGLERFKAFIEAAPQVISEDSSLEGQTPPDTASNSTLTEAEKAICRVQGLDEQDYLKTKQELELAAS